MHKKLFSFLCAHDVTVVVFGIILSLINIAFHRAVPDWLTLVLVNIAVSAFVVAIAYLDERKPNKAVTFIHFWYIVPLIFLTFKELYHMVAPIHGVDYDYLLIAADRWLFGVDPTVWLAHFAAPILTEVLQIAYSSFYILLMIPAIELYWKGDHKRLLVFVFIMMYGFFLSYLGYFILPAVGPRFILHDFDAMNQDLPGLFLTNMLRDFVNAGESIPAGVPNPIDFIQRDVFPSGHTMMTLILMYFGWKHRMKTRHLITIMGTLLIIGTVYLRYHYVIDLIGGAFFMLFAVWTSPPLYRWWEGVRGERPRSS